jgi:hypothetical protein
MSAQTSDMLVSNHKTTRRHNPEELDLNFHCRRSIKSLTELNGFGFVQFHYKLRGIVNSSSLPDSIRTSFLLLPDFPQYSVFFTYI